MKKKPAARKKAPARKPAAKKKPAKKQAPVRKKKTTIPRGGTRTTPPAPKPEQRRRIQPVPPGSEHAPMREPGGRQPEIRADDQHGPMHVPSHKPAPAYAEMHKRDWASKPPRQNIPIPKR
jgi:hypothetical protein